MSARSGVNAAESLRTQLAAALALDAGRSFWGEAEAMTRALEEVRRRHDNAAGEAVPADRILRAVAAFRREGKVSGYTHLRHVCLGAASLPGGGDSGAVDCLLADESLRDRLLALAEVIPGGRRQIKAFQCLLRAYWAFPLCGDASPEAREGLVALRDWLTRRYEELNATSPRRPHWFSVLGEHANLLSTDPCGRYGPALLRGDAGELQSVMAGLAIPGDSWVKEEAVLAQMRAATALDDAAWLGVLPQLLDIAAGKAGIAVSATLARRCVALCLARHARCETVERDGRLLEAAVIAVGNPWQRRAVWDAHVLNEAGKPCELARAMIDGWLKQLLIAGFFNLYGEDSEGRRRAEFWERYDPFITSLWIGLSAAAMERRDGGRDTFTSLAAGCLLLVDGIGDDDNVLIVRLGDFLAVEFAGGVRELHLFRWGRLDGRLTRRLNSARDTKYFSLSSLLEAEAEARLFHRDDEKSGSPWESRFDESLRPLLWRRA